MNGIITVTIPTDGCRSCYLMMKVENRYKKYVCAIHRKSIPSLLACNGEKPDWCPIKKIPEKKTVQTEVQFDGKTAAGAVVSIIKAAETSREANGWNSCIYEILKGE